MRSKLVARISDKGSSIDPTVLSVSGKKMVARRQGISPMMPRGYSARRREEIRRQELSILKSVAK